MERWFVVDFGEAGRSYLIPVETCREWSPKINKVPFSAYDGATGTNDKYRDTGATYDEVMLPCRSVVHQVLIQCAGKCVLSGYRLYETVRPVVAENY